jgi:DNA invertase Pin-like site-specific DNA recombinase
VRPAGVRPPRREPAVGPAPRRCAVYTRKSTDEGLDQEYNSIDAQRDAGHAYIASQKHEGWIAVADNYDDPGYSGGNLDRPALRRLMADIEAGKIDVVVVYKIDRLTRSLLDFSRLIDVLERHGTTFVSVTQQFNTTTSMGRLMLNVLLSFAQFEREVTGERIRDKIAASKRKGMWMGGMPPMGYDVKDRHLVVNPTEAKLVLRIFEGFARLRSGTLLVRELARERVTSKAWTTQEGIVRPGRPMNKTSIYKMVRNRIYLGEIRHRDAWYPGEHAPIVPQALWDAAQAVISVEPRRRGNEARAKVPFLLKGLLVDGQGRALQPWQTRKRSGRLYRYYISTRELKEHAGASGLPRFPADELESIVVGQVRAVLRTPEFARRIAEQARQHDPTLDEAQVSVLLLDFGRLWAQLAPAEQERLVRLLIAKIVVGLDTVEIRFNPLGARDLAAELAEAREAACA